MRWRGTTSRRWWARVEDVDGAHISKVDTHTSKPTPWSNAHRREGCALDVVCGAANASRLFLTALVIGPDDRRVRAERARAWAPPLALPSAGHRETRNVFRHTCMRAAVRLRTCFSCGLIGHTFGTTNRFRTQAREGECEAIGGPCVAACCSCWPEPARFTRRFGVLGSGSRWKQCFSFSC